MVGGLKECGNFAGEKKGTFLLVITIHSYLHYNTIYYLLFYIIIICMDLNTRTYINMLIHSIPLCRYLACKC